MRILFFTLFIGLTTFTIGQNLTEGTNTLLKFDVLLGEDILNALDSYTPSTTREKENFRESKKVLHQLLHDKAFEMMTSALQGKNIELEPRRTLEDHKLLYNDYGFPNVLIAKSVVKKVQKNGHSADHYMVFNISVGKGSDILGGSKLSRQFKQNTKVQCNILGPDGKKIKSLDAETKSDAPIKAKDFPNKKFDKLEIEYIELLVEKVLPGLEETIAKFGSKL